jgi:SnoaL-like protein
MSPNLPQAVLDAVAVTEVTQLVLTERESRDLGHWRTMRACFHDDSRIRISWFNGNGEDFVKGSIDMARRGVLAKHRLGPVRVRLAGERAVASLAGIIDIPTVVGGVEAQLSSHARFLFRAERRQERWGLSGFDAVYRRDELIPTIPGQVIAVTPAQLAGFRPSYRLLSFVLTSSGYQVNHELAGEDRPETTTALERELNEWAGLAPE